MRTDPRSPRRAAILAAVAVCIGLLPAVGVAQLPISLLDDQTEVASIDFRFSGTESFSTSRLRREIALTDRGWLHGLQHALVILPLIDEPAPHPFNPLDLQRDVARLREFYRRSGFPEVALRYEVTLDQTHNVVDVLFVVEEGPPRTLASLSYVGPSGGALGEALAPELVRDWDGFVRQEMASLGTRIGEEEQRGFEARIVDWLRDRGYPFALATSAAREIAAAPNGDAADAAVDLTVSVDLGRRRRVGAILVQGAESVSEGVFTREFAFEVGDWYSARSVREGRGRIAALPVVSTAVAEVVPGSASDSTASVLLRVRETRKRRISGNVGYTNVGGMAFGGQWEHLNFLRGARTFSAGASMETGWGAAFSETSDKYARGSVSLRQPFVLIPGLSFVASPFLEYRDDYRDRSWEGGADGTLVYQYGALRAISLRYRLSHRRVLEYAVSNDSDAPVLPPGTGLDDLSDRLTISVLTLSATFGSLDDVANPRHGFVLQPILELTGPSGFPSNEYLKADLWGTLYRELGPTSRVAASVRMGRVVPFGSSVPGPDDDGRIDFLQLRDVTLMAGGPSDVRGWASRLLGPKIPDLQVDQGDTGPTYSASRYLPMGGLARISGALELAFPLPGLPSSVGGHVFVDGARVWTPDERYELEDVFDQTGAFFSTGLGAGVETPVGPIRVSIGYKLNPSVLDLRDASDVLAAILEGQPVEEIPAKQSRRIQVHLTVGSAF